MKKIILSALAIGSVCAFASNVAQAASSDDVMARLAALEKENAAIRKENAALLENKRLRERNSVLKHSAPRRQSQQASVSPTPAVAQSAFDAYAALPVRREPLETRGQFRVWGEGGAFWSGGDPVSSSYSLTDFTGLGGLLGGGGGGGIPGIFNLNPKVGWEAAAGFDYRLANSPWHVSGQFRYGEGGKANGAASSAGIIDPTLLALLGGNNNPFAGATIGGSQDIAASYNETHWLADLAVGRDVIGAGPDAMQLKAGVRIAELTGTLRTSNNSNTFANFPAPVDIGIGFPISSFNSGSVIGSEQRDSFLGIGPRIGIEGSVPFASRWSFDYLGDAALLFGNQKQRIASTSAMSVSPAILALLLGGGGATSSVTTDQRFATLFNADIQVGVSYWLTQNVKLSASYRLDAFVNITDPLPGSMQTVNRYIHGPRLGVSGSF